MTSLPDNDTNFKIAYKYAVDEFLSGCIAATGPLKSQNGSIDVKVTETGNYDAAVVLYGWDSYSNISEMVISRRLTVSMNVKYDRTANYTLGTLLQLTGIIYITGPTMMEIYRCQKKKGRDDQDKADLRNS